MLDWIAKNFRLPATRLAGSAILLGSMLAQGQSPGTVSPVQSDPSEIYFQGYLAKRDAEKLEEAGDFIGASEKLQKANKLIENLHKFYPTWKPDMVQGSISQNYENLSRLFTKTEEQKKRNSRAVAELEGGQKLGGETIDPGDGVMPLTPGILEINPMDTKRLEDAEAEVKRLQQQLSRGAVQNSEASRNDSRVRDLAKQLDATKADLNAAQNNLRAIRGQLAAKPIESEMQALGQRIAGLEQEREAMHMALGQSRSEQIETLARNKVLEADLKVMQQKYADLDRDLKSERDVTNSVVAGQREQLRAMEKQLAEKSDELGKAHERILGLENQLKESNELFNQIRTERDSLLQERAQMSALLKLDEDGQIRDLVEQNMEYAKKLREANEKVDRLNLDSNSAKDDVVDALRDLAIAKSQINRLHQEKRDQDNRLEELEKRLKGEESALSKGQASSNPEEVAVLREIIQRQLRVQERRRQAKDLLVETVKTMGAKDERLSQAIELFDGQEMQLSPDEQKLLADSNVDGEFVSPFAQDRQTVGRNTSELNRDISVFERTAEKSFAAGRLLPTRELFQMIIEQHPGHVPALCKIGVVHLKLDDPASAVDTFRRAVELNSNNAYIHRMLSFALYKTGDYTAAEVEAKHAVELAPEDASNHNLLGGISRQLGRPKDAETNYKNAIAADPMQSDPYINLASLYARTKRIDEARDFYNQYLERGGLPDPALEQLLNEQ